ncbi:hypothetical protein ACIBG5_02225 [Kribbella sp. NPDC050241]|uniref:hypothetical protein n=1 Tax=Kribbella sp. NPDC050241 TaxID=3364115 RepID=UPI0037B10CC0
MDPGSSEQVLGGVQRKAEGEARSGVLRALSSNAAMCPPSAAQRVRIHGSRLSTSRIRDVPGVVLDRERRA